MWVSRKRFEALERKVTELGEQTRLRDYSGCIWHSTSWDNYYSTSPSVSMNVVVAKMAEHLGLKMRPESPREMIFEKSSKKA